MCVDRITSPQRNCSVRSMHGSNDVTVTSSHYNVTNCSLVLTFFLAAKWLNNKKKCHHALLDIIFIFIPFHNMYTYQLFVYNDTLKKRNLQWNWQRSGDNWSRVETMDLKAFWGVIVSLIINILGKKYNFFVFIGKLPLATLNLWEALCKIYTWKRKKCNSILTVFLFHHGFPVC